MGGKGGWQEMLTVLVAINAVMLLFNLIQIVSFLLLPGVSFILSIAALVWTVWATVIMIKTAHQFANIGQSIGLCLVVFVLSVAMMLVIVLVFGLGPAGSEYAF